MPSPFDIIRGIAGSLVNRTRAERFVLACVRRLEPVIATVEKGVYPLASRSSLDADAVAEVIAGAIGRPVRSVAFVSASRPLERPQWMTTEVFREMCRRVDLRRNIGEPMADALRVAFKYEGEELPFEETGAGIVADLHESLSNSRVASIGACIYFFGRAALAVDRRGMERLLRLVELLPKAVPLGEKKDAPGTWLVLCA